MSTHRMKSIEKSLGCRLHTCIEIARYLSLWHACVHFIVHVVTEFAFILRMPYSVCWYILIFLQQCQTKLISNSVCKDSNRIPQIEMSKKFNYRKLVTLMAIHWRIQLYLVLHVAWSNQYKRNTFKTLDTM